MHEAQLLSALDALLINKQKETSYKNLKKITNFKDKNFFFLSEEQKQDLIDEKLDLILDNNSIQNVQSAKQLGIIEWLNDKEICVFVKFKNKPLFMGETIDNKVYLTKEESLFLIESNLVICMYNSLQISIQEAYSLMIKNEKEYKAYIVYCYLLRFGFRLKKHSDNSSQSEIFSQIKNCPTNDLIKRNIEELNIPELTLKKKKNCENEDLENLNFNFNFDFVSDYFTSPYIEDSSINIDFFKFIRLESKNLENVNNWDELINIYDPHILKKNSFFLNNFFNFNKNLSNHQNLGELEIEDFFQNIKDCISHFTELLTDAELNCKLSENGPQLCSTDDFLFQGDETTSLIDYDLYFPKKKIKKSNTPDFYLKILHKSDEVFPIDLIMKLNLKTADRKKLVFAVAGSNEINFYQFTHVDLVK